MNLFLDIVRRNERLMNNISTMNNQDHNHNLNMHTSAQSINFQPRVNDINMYGGRRQPPYGKILLVFVNYFYLVDFLYLF